MMVTFHNIQLARRTYVNLLKKEMHSTRASLESHDDSATDDERMMIVSQRL